MSLYKNRSFRARLGFALQGLVHGVRAERSLQVQLLALAAALAALGMLRPSALESSTSAHHSALGRSEEHTSELQSLTNLVCRLLLEKKKKRTRVKSSQRAITTA